MSGNVEPNPHGRPLRRFADPSYQPQASTLHELREGIDAIDQQIVALIAKRALLVKDAARFKADSYQVSAPARQAEVFAKVQALTRACESSFAGLEQVTDATYRAMVAAFIAQEHTYFNTMIPETSHDSPPSAAV